jgi:penicillin-binding protein 2
VNLGLGKKLNIDLTGELDGIVQNPEWKRENRADIWYDGDTLNLAIGQGYLLVTPLQINALTNIIANKGILMKPYLVAEVRSAKSDEILYMKNPEILINSKIDKEHFDFIAHAMRGVVTEGTAKWGGAVFSTEAAGKTSSAEVNGRETHSWYTAFAPYKGADKDEIISITAIVEHGGAGSTNAAPIVAEITEAIFAGVSLETARKNIWKKRAEVFPVKREQVTVTE